MNKVYPRSAFPEKLVWNMKMYDCSYEWVKFSREKGLTEIYGSDNRLSWHRLTGVDILAFSNEPMPVETVTEPATSPLDYADD